MILSYKFTKNASKMLKNMHRVSAFESRLSGIVSFPATIAPPTICQLNIDAWFTYNDNDIVIIIYFVFSSPGNIFLLNLNVSVILAFLPIRLLELTDASTWQLGEANMN